jgi:predicted acyl esterase
MNKRPNFVVFLLGTFAMLTAAMAIAAEVEKTNVLIAMQDGVNLATDVYLPAGWGEPMPVLLKRTPYNKDTDYVSSDCPDTDFTVKLCDVYPDGRSMLVTDGVQKAKFRESCREAKWLTPGEVVELTVDMWSTSLVLAPGHRVRVCVSSSNYPRFDPNPNTGLAWAPEGKTRVATNTLHVSAQHASHIILPRYRGDSVLIDD